MNQRTENSTAEGMMEDPGCTVDATNVVWDMAAESMATGAIDPVCMETETSTIPDPEMTVRTAETQDVWSTREIVWRSAKRQVVQPGLWHGPQFQ